jgi:hypothetical protein
VVFFSVPRGVQGFVFRAGPHTRRASASCPAAFSARRSRSRSSFKAPRRNLVTTYSALLPATVPCTTAHLVVQCLAQPPCPPRTLQVYLSNPQSGANPYTVSAVNKSLGKPCLVLKFPYSFSLTLPCVCFDTQISSSAEYVKGT